MLPCCCQKPPEALPNTAPEKSNNKTAIVVVVLVILAAMAGAAVFSYLYPPAYQWITTVGWPAVTRFFGSQVGINVLIAAGIGVGLLGLTGIFCAVRVHRAYQLGEHPIQEREFNQGSNV